MLNEYSENVLESARRLCQQIGHTYIDVIVDQCSVDYSIIPALSGFSPEIKWQSLYKGLPEEIYPEDAPLLVRVMFDDLQQWNWLQALAKEMSSTAPLLIICSPWTLSGLGKWLTEIVNARQEGREGVFRFWDTRIFSYLFTDILSAEQQAQLKRPVIGWGWQDRDGQSVWLTGSGKIPKRDERAEQVDFSDKQYEKLMCLCDAKRFIDQKLLMTTMFASKEAEFRACFEGMVSATQAGVLFDDERDVWVIDYLTRLHAGI
ncbi:MULTISPECIES: DUF4123 domain-containing protein [Enterobacter]|uniref:DUF4123 domain-containing protein n=1 Tax=Enterobacter cloacae TaxID=550 RepID=A0A330GJZ7_ENTCL|nr:MULTISPECIES: DUF4123 domain-containing protein [Enterobacter cloacae complex]MEC5766613.1 DUF4123 domain-containing protein [Enterobacter chengduensis]RAZ72111.1 DUF4123 domain-containing protein [Enterobacter cloacae]